MEKYNIVSYDEDNQTRYGFIAPSIGCGNKLRICKENNHIEMMSLERLTKVDDIKDIKEIKDESPEARQRRGFMIVANAFMAIEKLFEEMCK
ncbi:hypothetical protein GOV13_05290 [Candidatus Pacearchaeota archaeon]|nr:hypothetical protein [Candidatus Pacearchaeota archaeon]